MLRSIVEELKRVRRELDDLRSDLRALAGLVGIPPRVLEGLRVEVLPKSVPDEVIERCVHAVGGRVLARSDAGFELDIPNDRFEEFERCLHEASAAS